MDARGALAAVRLVCVLGLVDSVSTRVGQVCAHSVAHMWRVYVCVTTQCTVHVHMRVACARV